MAEIPEFTTRPELRGTFGMVASTHWLASAVGMAVLEEGGNAFDAAVATGLALQVVAPHLNGAGGRDDLPFPFAGPRPRSGDRAARRVRSGGLRRVDAAAARVRDARARGRL